MISAIRVYGTTAQKARLDYAMEVGRHVTDYYQDFFKVRDTDV
jgi:hypothetical protein